MGTERPGGAEELSARKAGLLTGLLELTKKQSELLSDGAPEAERFDALLEERRRLIGEADEVDRLMSLSGDSRTEDEKQRAAAAERELLQRIIELDNANQTRLSEQRYMIQYDIVQQKAYTERIGHYLEPFADSGGTVVDEKK